MFHLVLKTCPSLFQSYSIADKLYKHGDAGLAHSEEAGDGDTRLCLKVATDNQVISLDVWFCFVVIYMYCKFMGNSGINYVYP